LFSHVDYFGGDSGGRGAEDVRNGIELMGRGGEVEEVCGPQSRLERRKEEAKG
jgi:hypothetical protein